MSDDGKVSDMIKVWNALTGQEELTLKGHLAHVSSVVFSPDGKSILTVSDDSTVRVWSTDTGIELRPPIPWRSSGLLPAGP